MSETTRSTSISSFLPRIYWMLLGPVLIFVGAGLLAKHPAWSFGWRDLLFWGAIGSLVLGRWLDMRLFGGLTADGTPTTPQHVRRHALTITSIGLAVWLLVQSIQV